jgi:hypothetical protein
MVAYYRCGRRAEALDTYQAARDVLAREIGADPGPELQALQQQVLRDDSALAAPPAPGGPAGPPGQRACGALAGEVPRQLPSTVACFAGRGAELAALTGLLGPGPGGPGPGGAAPAVVISAIGGTAGVGKPLWQFSGLTRLPGGSQTGSFM